jgi:PiT family inorganic phosphate transporter
LNLQQADGALKKNAIIFLAAFSLGHGGNDSQKVMGIMQQQLRYMYHQSVYKWMRWLDVVHLKLVRLKYQDGYHSLLLSNRGWNTKRWLENVKTMGSKITKVTSFEGVAAETADIDIMFY